MGPPPPIRGIGFVANTLSRISHTCQTCEGRMQRNSASAHATMFKRYFLPNMLVAFQLPPTPAFWSVSVYGMLRICSVDAQQCWGRPGGPSKCQMCIAPSCVQCHLEIWKASRRRRCRDHICGPGGARRLCLHDALLLLVLWLLLVLLAGTPRHKPQDYCRQSSV